MPKVNKQKGLSLCSPVQGKARKHNIVIVCMAGLCVKMLV